MEYNNLWHSDVLLVVRVRVRVRVCVVWEGRGGEGRGGEGRGRREEGGRRVLWGLEAREDTQSAQSQIADRAFFRRRGKAAQPTEGRVIRHLSDRVGGEASNITKKEERDKQHHPKRGAGERSTTPRAVGQKPHHPRRTNGKQDHQAGNTTQKEEG